MNCQLFCFDVVTPFLPFSTPHSGKLEINCFSIFRITESPHVVVVGIGREWRAKLRMDWIWKVVWTLNAISQWLNLTFFITEIIIEMNSLQQTVTDEKKYFFINFKELFSTFIPISVEFIQFATSNLHYPTQFAAGEVEKISHAVRIQQLILLSESLVSLFSINFNCRATPASWISTETSTTDRERIPTVTASKNITIFCSLTSPIHHRHLSFSQTLSIYFLMPMPKRKRFFLVFFRNLFAYCSCQRIKKSRLVLVCLYRNIDT